MALFKSMSIRAKLAVLAGTPLIGILILSVLIVGETMERAATAEALGSIEDLARLSSSMSGLLDELQSERAYTAMAVARPKHPRAELEKQRQRTDRALAQLEEFLSARDLGKLPPRLARDLRAARTGLAGLAKFRRAADQSKPGLQEILQFFSDPNASLVRATAALTQLSDDGELLRSISTLVAVLEVKERASREHALLSFVFAKGEFPPGSYRELVTLLTEAKDYEDVLRSYATDEQLGNFEAALEGKQRQQAQAMRKLALETTEEELEVDPTRWFQVQKEKLGRLRNVELDLSARVGRAAAAKSAEAQRWVRLSITLAGSAALISMVLAFFIVRGITRSVAELSGAAAEVRQKEDYSVRVRKTTRDELGVLTDAFNDMLSGIQTRDRELAQHRENLEHLVEERTAELAERNRQMRLVLDNVQQGLATVGRDGGLSQERSAAFDRWFGAPSEDVSFFEHLAKADATMALRLRLAWEQLMEDVLPTELCIEQMPRRLDLGDANYALAFTPIERAGRIDGALMMISDVTAEIAAQRAEAEQREFVKVFERAIQDRVGFFEFLNEVGQLVKRLLAEQFDGPRDVLRAVHTIKGNCSLFNATSIADVAHELETKLLDEGAELFEEDIQRLASAWARLSDRLATVMEIDSKDRVEVTHGEIDELVRAAFARTPHQKLAQMLEELKYEPAVARFQRIKRQARALARRLGKAPPTVVCDGGGVRLPAARWAPFWSAFVHVVRNAVDHGIGTAEERASAGKPPNGKLTLRARSESDHVTIQVSDDGRGIDWERIRERAREAGLPHQNQSALVDALFAEGLSTAENVTRVSGRGIGLSALRQACRDLDGTIQVTSKPGDGTTFIFRFPVKLRG
jgi:two-component system chemotaxis sensor kinase CheA